MLLWGYALNITCILYIQYNGAGPKPLIFKPNEIDGFLEYDLVETNYSNSLKLNDSIILICPNSNIVVDNKKLQKEATNATCYKNDIYYMDFFKGTSPLHSIKCEGYPLPKIRKTNRICNNNYQELAISINIEETYLDIMNFCFDAVYQRTLYAKFTIKPYSKYYFEIKKTNNNNNIRYKWSQDGNIYHLGKMTFDKIYRKFAYKKYINLQLGLSQHSKDYIEDGSIMSKVIVKGQLVSKSDFFYEALQSLTHHYVNTAPQWMSLSMGNWLQLRKCIKKFINMYGVDLTVYSGTHGFCQLPDSQGIPQQLFLYVDDFNNKFIPVPQLFWLILYDPNIRAGVAFVSVNNPHLFYQEDVLCHNICKKLPWITWDATNAAKGYSYCCEVDELRKSIEEIPNDFVVDRLLN